MPAGYSDPVTGYVTFAGIKALGYCLFAWRIRARYEAARNSEPIDGDAPSRVTNPVVVGLTRTVIGMSFGLAAWAIMGEPTPIPLPALPFLRVAEWWILLWLYFDRRLGHPAVGWRLVAEGILVSFVLDVPAALGFLFVSLSIC